MKQNKGILFALLPGIMWGFSGTCGQFIFERFDIDPAHLTSIRMLIAGFVLICFGLVTDREEMKAILKRRDSAVMLLLSGTMGIMFSQVTYMKSIFYTNSGTATILQYLGPVLVMAISCVMYRKLPAPVELAAVVLAVAGTFFIATHGSVSNLVINTAGLIWGFLSAVGLALYTLLPVEINKRHGSIPVSAYGMAIGGITLALISRLWTLDFHPDYRFFLAFAGIVVFGTIFPFAIYLKGMAIIGPVRASMIASVEPVSAAVFMIIWLKVPFHIMDLLGFVCILATVFLLAKPQAERQKSRAGLKA